MCVLSVFAPQIYLKLFRCPLILAGSATMKTFVILLTVCVGVALGYSSGAQPPACEKLTPIHKNAPNPQTSPVPYSLTVRVKYVQRGSPVRVTLSGNNVGNVFTGFMLQARDGNVSQGEFRVLDPVNSQVMQCKKAGVSSKGGGW